MIEMVDEEELTKDELIAELDKKYEPKHQIETPKPPASNNKTFYKAGMVALIIILAGSLILYGDIDEFKPVRDWIFGVESELGIVLTPADIELYRFSDLAGNDSVNVELWLINLGEDTATDIEIFVRARNQNGTILLSETISPTVLLLKDNETCSAIYTIPITEDDEYIVHTLEIQWHTGRKAYSKQTNL